MPLVNVWIATDKHRTMKRPSIVACALLIIGCGASDARQTCVDRTEDLRLDCGVGVVYVEGAAALGDCSESVTCCQDPIHGDDVITAWVRDWCDGLARCHVTASTWYRAANRERTSLAVSYMCDVRAHIRSGMKMSVDLPAELRVMPAIQNTTQCYGSYFYQQLCFGDTTIEITDAVYGVSPCNSDGLPTDCCQSPGDCTIPVDQKDPDDHPDYYNEILVSCNNKRTCDDLRAEWINNIYQWCPGVSGPTDYVTLHYMCLTDADRLTTRTAATTDVTIPSTNPISTIKPGPRTVAVSMATTDVLSMSTNAVNDSDSSEVDSSPQTTVIIAVVVTVVVVVVAVVVAVTVWMVYRKRRANTTSEGSRTVGAQSPGLDNSIHLPEAEPLPQSPPRMMTSHAPAGVDDADPYYVNSQSSPGFYDVIKPATEAYEPLRPYNRPEVAPITGDYVNVVDTTMEGTALYSELARGTGVVPGKAPGEGNTPLGMEGAFDDLMLVESHQYGTR